MRMHCPMKQTHAVQPLETGDGYDIRADLLRHTLME